MSDQLQFDLAGIRHIGDRQRSAKSGHSRATSIRCMWHAILYIQPIDNREEIGLLQSKRINRL